MIQFSPTLRMVVGIAVLMGSWGHQFQSEAAQPSETRALVYRGPGACDEECSTSAYEMAVRSGLNPTYVGPQEITSLSTDGQVQDLFKNVTVWIQPGGKSSTVLENMEKRLVDALRVFVQTGGGYVGFCAGAFAATQRVGTTSIEGFNLFPGLTTLYRSRWTADVIPVQWEGKTRYVYWEGGPYISEIPQGKAEVIALYPNGQIASARSQFGKGKVFITGFHPEAPQDWRDYYGLKDPDGLDYELVDEMIQWVRTP